MLKRIALVFAFIVGAVGSAAAQYKYGPQISTTTGGLLEGQAGHFFLQKSSANTTRTIRLDGLSGGVDASSFTAVYGLLGGTLTVSGAATVGGNATVDGGTFHVDSSANRIGVGTTSPATTVDIQQNGFEVRLGSGSGTGQAIGSLTYGVATSNSLDLYGRAGKMLGLGANGANAMLINTSGNVGVGTTSPAAKLDVAGLGIAYTLRSQDATAPKIDFYEAASFRGTVGYNSDATFATPVFKLRATGAVGDDDEGLTISGAGNFVGVGKVATQEFDVEGDIVASGRVGVGTTSPAFKLDVTGEIASNGIQAINVTGGNVIVGNPAGGGTQDVYLAAGGDYRLAATDAGLIGIGTILPATKLHLSSGTVLIDGNASSPVYAIQNGASKIGLYMESSAGGACTGTGVGDACLRTDTSGGNIALANAAGATRVMIENAGDVGVGTTQPSRPLDINHATAPEIGFRISDTASGSIFAESRGIFADAIAGDSIYLRPNGGAQTFVVSGGAVTVVNSSTTLKGPNGVATGTCSAETLCVSNAGNASASIQAGPGNSSVLYFEDDTIIDGRIYYSHAARAMGFGTAQNSGQMYIESGGDVGIGTTSPAYRLDVAGNANVSGTYSSSIAADDTPGSGWAYAGKDSYWGFGSNTDNAWTLDTYNTANAFQETLKVSRDGEFTFLASTMTVYSSGNVAIGGAGGANYRLDVKAQTSDNTKYAARFRDSADATLLDVRNDGVVSGSANLSGEYTAVASTQTNVDTAAATAASWRYVRLGAQVMVFGQVTIDPTAAANADSEIFLTLPIASNLSASADLSGTCVGFGTTDRALQISGAPTQDQASVTWRSDTTGAILYSCSLSYEVK